MPGTRASREGAEHLPETHVNKCQGDKANRTFATAQIDAAGGGLKSTVESSLRRVRFNRDRRGAASEGKASEVKIGWQRGQGLPYLY